MQKILNQHFLDSSVICCYFLSYSKWWESFSRDSLENDSSWINLTHRIKYHGSNGLVPNFPAGFNVRLWPSRYYKSGSNFLCLYSRSFDILPMPVCAIKGFIISCQRDNYKFWIPIKSVIERTVSQENNRGEMDNSACYGSVLPWGNLALRLSWRLHGKDDNIRKERILSLHTERHFSAPLGPLQPPVWGHSVVSRRCRWATLETWYVTQNGVFLVCFLPLSTSGLVLILLS